MKNSAPKIHHFFTVSFSPFTSSWNTNAHKAQSYQNKRKHETTKFQDDQLVNWIFVPVPAWGHFFNFFGPFSRSIWFPGPKKHNRSYQWFFRESSPIKRGTWYWYAYFSSLIMGKRNPSRDEFEVPLFENPLQAPPDPQRAKTPQQQKRNSQNPKIFENPLE